VVRDGESDGSDGCNCGFSECDEASWEGDLRVSTKLGSRALAQSAVAVIALASVSTLTSSSWKVVQSPNVPGQAELTGVSCASPSFCVAVGQSGMGTLAESWDGHSWSLAPTPRLGGVNFLTDVDCVSPDSCMAVGDVGASNLVERWDGTAWRVTSAPPGQFTMRKLACSTSGLCVAIGNTESGAVLSVWSGGEWTVYGLPKRSLADDVACASPTFCVAVGATYQAPYAATWNGVRWSSSRPVALHDATFLGVSCWSASGCLAVGAAPTTQGDSGVSEEWIGHRWSTVPIPSPNHFTVTVTDVTCAGPRDCVAVGEGVSRSASGAIVPLAYLWNGKSWRVEGTPHLSGGGAFGAATLAGGFAVAVGERGSRNHSALIEQR
jgi:hypothetical protein